MERFAKRLVALLASRKFFIFVVGLLVFQALWLAFSFAYAMLWDEYYHFGLIQFYAHHLSPFISSQPHSADIYGEITRYPAWGYHWLMSFPYRLISLITSNESAQIITLRIINIAIFAGALVAWRAALLRLIKSKALVNFVFLVLVLLPLSSLLAAQINYDSLQFLFAGLTFYWVLRFIQAKQFEFKWLALVIGTSLLASIEKYTFLPFFAALAIFLIYWIVKNYRQNFRHRLSKSFKALSRTSQVGLIMLLLVGAGLFVERYGVNLVKYHAIEPDCAQVLSEKRCLSFSPYNRNHQYQLAKGDSDLLRPLEFATTTWVGRLYNQYFSTGTRVSYAKYTVKRPLPVPFTALLVAIVFTAVCFLAGGFKLLRRPEMQLALLTILLLAAALFYTNYTGYVRNGQPVAIQGRYMLPVVPLALGLGVATVNAVIRRQKYRALLATVFVLGLLAGGGLTTHLVRSEPNWYWQNRTVINVNNGAKQALNFLEFDYR